MINYRCIIDIYRRIEGAPRILRLKSELGRPSGHIERVVECLARVCFGPVLEQHVVANVSLSTVMLVLVH